MIRFLEKLIKAYFNHSAVNYCYSAKFLVFFSEPNNVRKKQKSFLFRDVIRKVKLLMWIISQLPYYHLSCLVKCCINTLGFSLLEGLCFKISHLSFDQKFYFLWDIS